MSAARPKIANYPFTTLIPHLGVVEAGETQFVVADVPGLIPGASEGRGLGLDFLRHVERCAVLVHVIDCATEEPGRDPITDLDVLEAELTAYDELTGADMASRPRIVVLNKIDVPEARDLAEIVAPDLQARGPGRVPGLRRLGRGAARAGVRSGGRIIAQARSAAPQALPTRLVIRPEPVAGPDFELVRTGGEHVQDPWRQAAQVDQADRFQQRRGGRLPGRPAGAKLGIEEALAQAGAEPGAEVLIGEEDNSVVFDWDPKLPTGAGFGPRGTDRRLSR